MDKARGRVVRGLITRQSGETMSSDEEDVRRSDSVVSHVRVTIDADHVADPRRMICRCTYHRRAVSDECRGDSKKVGGEIVDTMSGYLAVMSETM